MERSWGAVLKVRKISDIFHVGFEVGLLLKGLDSLLEIIGGVVLLFLNPDRLNWLTRLLLQHELSEDPEDMVANFLLAFSHSFSVSTQNFGVFYLMSHGIIKCILVLLLWQRKLWAYPLTIISLILFIAYQIYRYTFTQSVFLLFLTIFDIVMIVLTYLEYKKLKDSYL
jgi:uncharacterized membrane protein